jgi:hypothetical protein
MIVQYQSLLVAIPFFVKCGGGNMNIAPLVQPGDWVAVGQVEGYAQSTYSPGTNAHVFDLLYMDRGNIPTVHPVDWNGFDWAFYPSEHYYGRRARDSEPFVRELKQKYKRITQR